MSAGFEKRGYAAGGNLLAPAPTPDSLAKPPRRRAPRVMVAATVAVLMIAGGAGWMLVFREAEPEPVMLRLAFPKGGSYLYRVESTGEATADIGGTGRRLSTQMEGLLKFEVQRLQNDGAQVHGDLTLFSFVANGRNLSKPRRIRQPLRIGFDGPVLGGLFSTEDGWPILSLPALSPLLPKRMMQPGDESEARGVQVFSKKDPVLDGTTQFIGYEEVDGVRLAVLEGVLTGNLEEAGDRGTGEVRVDIRARIDPSAGMVHDAQGRVDADVVSPDFVGKHMTVTETFRLFLLNGVG